MTEQPLTDAYLDEVDARAAYLDEYATLTDGPLQADLDEIVGTDIPALLAEIRRQRGRITELERITTPRTLRICARGHGHLAHAVPAPHSCFAHDQTCPCEAYQQLPHDEAEAQLKRNQQAAAEHAAAEEESETGTRPCGHDDYHDGHPWHDRPSIWCPGISYADDEAVQA